MRLIKTVLICGKYIHKKSVEIRGHIHNSAFAIECGLLNLGSDLLKEFLKKLFAGVTVTLKKGPLKGQRWIMASGNRFIQGRYDPNAVDILSEHIKPGFVCYDIGAHIGYLAFVMAKHAGKDGQIYAFEPRPLNLLYLQKHIKINKIDNILVFDFGISDKRGELRFTANTGSGTGHISEDGNITIHVESMDELIAEKGLRPPDFIKMDIEGGELNALQGAAETLKKYHPILLISTHGDEIHQQCMALLVEIGYQIDQDQPGDFLATYAH